MPAGIFHTAVIVRKFTQHVDGSVDQGGFEAFQALGGVAGWSKSYTPPTLPLDPKYHIAKTFIVGESAYGALRKYFDGLPSNLGTWTPGFMLVSVPGGVLMPSFPFPSFSPCNDGQTLATNGLCPNICNYWSNRFLEQLGPEFRVTLTGHVQDNFWAADPLQSLREPLVNLLALNRLGPNMDRFYGDGFEYAMVKLASESGNVHGASMQSATSGILDVMADDPTLDQIIDRSPSTLSRSVDALALYGKVAASITAGKPIQLRVGAGGIVGRSVLATSIKDCGLVRYVYVYDPERTYPAGTRKDEARSIAFRRGSDGTWSMDPIAWRGGETYVDVEPARKLADPRTTAMLLMGKAREIVDALTKNATALFTVACPADALFTDSQGRRIGHLRGQPAVNEIPGARITNMGNIESFEVPAGETYRAVVSGRAMGGSDVEAIVPVAGKYGAGWIRQMTFPRVFLTGKSRATFSVGDRVLSALESDIDGDGKTDEVLVGKRFSAPVGFASLDPLFLHLDLKPRKLTLHSYDGDAGDGWMKAIVYPPPGASAENLLSAFDANGLVLEGTVPSERFHIEHAEVDDDDREHVDELKEDREKGESVAVVAARLPRVGVAAEAAGASAGGSEVDLTLFGRLSSGRPVIAYTKLGVKWELTKHEDKDEARQTRHPAH